ncbi:FAD-binding oxidoreductase [Pseudoxanthobacter sp.]|uniref:FAD-binding oxidoreductase n=1 Tax=Pseudoxanthobacter sp. TaxID=1925742 RepID=UPI002FE1F084
MTSPLPDLAPLKALLGPAGWKEAEADIAPFTRDWLNSWGTPPLGVALPADTQAVAAVVAFCAENGLSITPQGGNTGLNGASVLSEGARGIILSLSRMNRILAIDPVDFSVTVEAGVVLAALHEALEAHELMLPLHLGAEGSAQIGGLIATNAGGSHAMRFGMMEAQVLGLEAVLPDGQVWDGLRALIKDNTGYALRKLFCGAEGTLGIVTKAVLRLHPRPVTRATALIALPDLETAVRTGAALRRSTGAFLFSLEFFGEFGLALLLGHVPGLSRPLETPGPVYLLIELATSVAGIDLSELLEGALAAGFEDGSILDGVVAGSEAQRAALWRLREELPEGQRREGAQIKHDVAVPVSRLPDFVARATAAAEAVLPGVRISPFGHLGDGNVHFNLSAPAGSDDFSGRNAALSEAVYGAALDFGGTFSAEHGLGQAKIALADRLRAPAERTLMRRIKHAFDPRGTLNPGKVVRD